MTDERFEEMGMQVYGDLHRFSILLTLFIIYNNSDLQSYLHRPSLLALALALDLHNLLGASFGCIRLVTLTMRIRVGVTSGYIRLVTLTLVCVNACPNSPLSTRL